MAAPPTNPIDLTFLAQVKSRAEVNPTSTSDDPEIQSAITAFSQWLLNFTGKASLNSVGSYNEVYDGNGNLRLFLRNNPIQTITTLNVNGVSVPIVAATAFNSWGAFIETSQKSIAIRAGIGNFSTFPYPTAWQGSVNGYRQGGPSFFYGIGNIQVQYTAGYLPTTVSNDIENVTAQTVTLAFGPWAADIGVVYYPSLVPLVNVPNSPAVGQYAVSSGLYVFNVGDNNKLVALSYQINRAPADLEYAVRCVVALNYKRKSWQDQKSRVVTASGTSATTSYRDWTWPPEYQQIFEHYQRKSPS